MTVVQKNPYCFDALVENGFVDEVEFPKLSNEFDVAQHLDLRNSTLLLLLRGELAIMLFKDYTELKNKQT